jgi:hypothetical protein
LITQQQSIPNNAGSTSASMLAAWHMGVTYKGDLICAGPKYQYNYAEGVHLTAHEYDRLGAKYGEVYYEKVVLGHDWQPLQPKTVTRSGRAITVDFNVPVGALNWDENILAPHQTVNTEWAMGKGFEVRSGAATRLAIATVAIDATKVVITLAADPPAGNLTVGYATIVDEMGNNGGPVKGRRGQLRDSDPLVGLDAETVSCNVTMGSADIQANTAGAFKAHGPRDIAEGASLAAETIVLSKMSDSAMTLSTPWMGATGTVDLKLRSDHRNYCVSFELPVP